MKVGGRTTSLGFSIRATMSIPPLREYARPATRKPKPWLPASSVPDPERMVELYAAIGSDVAQFSIPGTGVLTPLTPPSASSSGSLWTLSVDLSGKFVYACDSTHGTVWLFSVGADGTLSPLPTPSINPNGAVQFAFAGR